MNTGIAVILLWYVHAEYYLDIKTLVSGMWHYVGVPYEVLLLIASRRQFICLSVVCRLFVTCVLPTRESTNLVDKFRRKVPFCGSTVMVTRP